MLEAGDRALGFAAGRSRTDLDSDEMLRFALVKLVEIVGEAAKQVSDETRVRYPAVAWAEAARMRDRLVHHYFDINLDMPAAGLVLVLMNVATIIPLWPGNVGLLQAAIALPLVEYGIPYANGFAFGLGLQAIEASVGVGFGLAFLGREGLSFATLRGMPAAVEAEVPEEEEESEPASEVEHARARVSG